MPSTDPDKASRLGLSLTPSNAFSLTDMVEAAGLADDLGYESVWVPETWGYDAASMLTVVATKTTRIGIASGVFNVYSRSAALIAQTVATLQTISGGRFTLGLGPSGPRVIENWHGVPYRAPLARTGDYVKIIRQALAGDRVDFHSDRLQLSGFRLAARPPAPVPIYIAALGPANIRLTGRIADGWLPIFAVRGHMAGLLDVLSSGAEEAGRNRDSIDVAAYIPCVIGGRGERLLAQQLAYYIGGMGNFYAAYMARLGFGPAVEEIRLLWLNRDRPAAVRAVPVSLLESATLGTTASSARERLRLYRSEGVGLPIVTLPAGATPEEVAATVSALAPVT